MKKFLFLAATAMMFAACSNEEITSPNTGETAIAEKAVGFDVYVPGATDTRAGLEGTMTTGRLQRSEANGGGFGVYAYLVEDVEGNQGEGLGYASSYLANGASSATSWRTTPVAPNFMVNEKILWNATNQGWYYSPLKYWPNETDNDSQNTPAEMTQLGDANQHLDRLTFFAYAPYVATGAAGVPGITGVTDNAGLLAGAGSVVEPTISYQAAITDPNDAVDLLWGVAPAGGLTYTAVNGRTVNVPEGQPLMDMTKPDVNTNMKFLFQHALARIGVKAVAAVDQVGVGGTLDPNTKITIKSITLTGMFGTTGKLNLDNPTPNVANWVDVNGTTVSGNTAVGTPTTLTISGSTIAEHLRFVGTHASPAKQESAAGKHDRVGVTTVKQDVLEPATYSAATPWVTVKYYDNGESFDYSETTPYYTDEACTAKAQADVVKTNTIYTINSKGVITQVADPADVEYPTANIWYDGLMYQVTAADVSANTYDSYQAYTYTDVNSSSSVDAGDTFTPKAVGTVPVAGDYVIKTAMKKAVLKYASTADDTPFYKRDANYFMVVPTNNFAVLNSLSAAEDEALRTVKVKITYYITTEDENLAGGVAQTENVIEKNVVFPSIANGKSYNLNLVLGLTSVKMEAEVDDWKVINVQGDLPQNTAE